MFQFIEKIEMDLDSIYRRLSDICILLNRLISDIKEHGDQLQLGGEQITLQLLQERRRTALERYEHDFEEQRRRDISNNSQKSLYQYLEERRKGIADGTLAEDEIDGQSHHKCN